MLYLSEWEARVKLGENHCLWDAIFPSRKAEHFQMCGTGMLAINALPWTVHLSASLALFCKEVKLILCCHTFGT